MNNDNYFNSPLMQPGHQAKKQQSYCCCETRHIPSKLTEQDLMISNKAKMLKFGNLSPRQILQSIKRYSYYGKISVAAIYKFDIEIGGQHVSRQTNRLRYLFYRSFVINTGHIGHTGGSGGGYSVVTPSASSTTSAAPSANKQQQQPPPADYTEDESSQYDPMADPYTSLDAVKLVTALIFLCTATKSQRAYYLFETYDLISEGYLCEKEVRFLFANSFFLVANALPALFVPKERGQSVIRNQARAMQARVKQETNSIVHKLIKNIINKNSSGIFAFGSDSDPDNNWFHQSSSKIKNAASNSNMMMLRNMNSPQRQINLLTNSTGGDQNQSQQKRMEKLKKQQSEVRITRQEFIFFFKKSSKLSNLLEPQGLRDAVMPVIMSKGSFQWYKAAGDVVTLNKKGNNQNFAYPPKRHTLLSSHRNSNKKVHFNDVQPLVKKNYSRENWHDSVVGNSSLVMGGVPLTSSMRKSQIYDESNNNISETQLHVSILKQSRDVSQFTESSNWSHKKSGGDRQRGLSSVSFSSGKSSGNRTNKVPVPAKIFIGEDLPPN